MTAVDVIGTETLLRAQATALTHDERVDTLGLGALAAARPDIADRIITATATLTIQGASTLTIGVNDPEWDIETSGILDIKRDRELDQFVVAVDDLRFALTTATRLDADTLTLTFEDLAAALLRPKRKHLTARRGTVTRGEFIERMVREVKTLEIPFFSPERSAKQPVQSTVFPDTRPTADDPNQGFDKGARFKIKDVSADAQQRREVATVMGVCDQEGVNDRVRLAALVAGIGESSFIAQANQAGSGYWGVFQGAKDTWKLHDTEGMARAFLHGGKGFQGGGAIALNRANPDWTPGHIAYVVEGDISNFPSAAAAERFYQVHIGEAKKIAGLWKGNGTSTTGTQTVLREKAYHFTRGLPGHKESTWEAATRLAAEVNWRFYIAGGVASFVSDDWLITRPVEYTIGDTTGSLLERCANDGLIEPPTYDWDHGKVAATCTINVDADRWGIRPGRIVAFQKMGPVTGRWIVETVDLDLLNSTATRVTLVKPIPPRKEPAAELVSVTTATDGAGTLQDPTLPGGVGRAIAWARAMLGHYGETWGRNRGPELDKLEAQFGFPGSGAPWCAMFATTVLVHGGVDRSCRTAAVAQILAWARAHTNGYLHTVQDPKPGDLVCYGTEHVGVIEKVHGQTVTTIEGNTSAGKVARRSSLLGTGTYVRPDYPA